MNYYISQQFGDTVILKNQAFKTYIYRVGRHNIIETKYKEKDYGEFFSFNNKKLIEYTYSINPGEYTYNINFHKGKGILSIYGNPLVDTWKYNNSDSVTFFFSMFMYDSIKVYDLTTDNYTQLNLKQSKFSPYILESNFLPDDKKIILDIECFINNNIIRSYFDTITVLSEVSF